MKSEIAGPTLRALVAARIDRDLRLNAGMHGGVAADRSRPAARETQLNGVRSVATNVVERVAPDLQSCLSWEITHPKWSLRFTDRRTRDADGGFARAAPQAVFLGGDLLEAGQFLGLGRDQFFAAVAADGWSRAEVTVQRLRWLDAASGHNSLTLNAMMRLL